MKVAGKQVVKQLLGEVPFTAELYWLLRQRGQPLHSRFSLRHLQAELPSLVKETELLRKDAPGPGRKVFIFATLHYWIEHAALLGLALSSQGHKVTLGYMPYAEWQTPINRFDLRRQNAYAAKVLSQASPHLETVSFLTARSLFTRIPEELMTAVEQVSIYDTQYTLQVEDIDRASEIYKLRLERNTEVARAALGWLKANRPDVVIIPNGTIQELGVVYHVARYLGIRTVTYEFGDQRQRIWLAQNGEVMRQETDELWQARAALSASGLRPEQLERMRSLFMARQRGALWENFARPWQDTPASGGEKARAALGLDSRPVVLLATNVLGDSLTLGRQVFSQSMAEWIARTVQYFAGRPDVQLVIRVHPGEVLTHGQSMVDVVKQVLPRLPEHIRLITPKEKVNTYDLVEVADLGLVYTTTVGMEMAMYGVPVIVSGQTHYRARGFTYDPDSWVAYFKLLGQILSKPSAYRLSRGQVESAWEYAYRFFFEYPRPFPWHLVRVWEDYKTHSLTSVCGPEGQALYGPTFSYLVGDPINWHAIVHLDGHAAQHDPAQPVTGTVQDQPSDTPSPVDGPQVGIPQTGGHPQGGNRSRHNQARIKAARERAATRAASPDASPSPDAAPSPAEKKPAPHKPQGSKPPAEDSSQPTSGRSSSGKSPASSKSSSGRSSAADRSSTAGRPPAAANNPEVE